MRSGAAVTIILSNGAWLGPAVIAIGNLELNVGAALSAESLLRLLPKLFDDLDAVHFASQLRENCGLITKTGADLKDGIRTFDADIGSRLQGRFLTDGF